MDIAGSQKGRRDNWSATLSPGSQPTKWTPAVGRLRENSIRRTSCLYIPGVGAVGYAEAGVVGGSDDGTTGCVKIPVNSCAR